MSKSAPIQRVLVANRGEIAVRVIRACRELGIGVVAVASEADRFSLHGQLADEVVEIGPPAASESYLVMDRVIQAGLDSGCDAVHPGYGFLAENADFAKAVSDAGMRFIGPSPEVIENMGLKTKARALMESAGVPVIPGSKLPENAEDEATLKQVAQSVGYPVLVKAAAGGGGKGMRAVHSEEDLVEAVQSARREAASAFGNAEVYLERLLLRPRHIEVQILGDSQGTVLHLGERECSVQRRHQKVVEESPAAHLDDTIRHRMWETAVRAGEAVGYVGAGTVEMLLDQSGEFFFLEMNTRLQVEHPVTEWVTGMDLVVEQIRVAQGEALPWAQSEITPRGHSIEVRLYAEDPAEGFLPQTGEVLLFEPPGGPGVRVDTGISNGTEVGLHYDAMIAKLSAWAESREKARRRLVEALHETVLLGVGSNLAYLSAILEHPAFADEPTHTGFLDEHLADWHPGAEDGDADPRGEALLAAAAAIFGGHAGRLASTEASLDGDAALPGPWSRLGPLRLDAEEAR